MTAAVGIEGVGHRYGATRALSGIELDIEAGEYVVLLGPSGCGKTTLLSILGGFLVPDEGRVSIGGRDMTDVPAARRPTATMFQDYALFPHMSLEDNVGFGPRMAGVGRQERRRRASRLLALVGLGGAERRRPRELSGGQRQRVALARALAVEPKLLLLDEPLGALDMKLRRNMQDELKAIQRQVGTTFVHVTHDQEEAMAIADRVVIMRAGAIEDVGRPSRLYASPATAFAAGFMGEVNRISGRIETVADGTTRLTTPLGPAELPRDDLGGAGTRVTLCVRPEDLSAGGDLAWRLGSAKVEAVAFLGTQRRCRLRPEEMDAPLTALLPAGAAPEAGAAVRLSVDPARVLAFADDRPAPGLQAREWGERPWQAP